MFKNIFTQIPKDTWNTNRLYETSLTKDLIDLDTCSIALHPAATVNYANVSFTLRFRSGACLQPWITTIVSGDSWSLMLLIFSLDDSFHDYGYTHWQSDPDYFVRGVQISTDQPLIYGAYSEKFSDFLTATYIPEYDDKGFLPSVYAESPSWIVTSNLNSSPYVRYLDAGHHHLPEVY